MGEVGPYAGQKVYDYVIQGMSGLLEAQGVQDPYAMVRTIIFDKVTALTAAQAMTAALFARERGAGGQHIALSMLDTAVYFNWADLMWNQSFEGDGAALAGDLADLYEVSTTSAPSSGGDDSSSSAGPVWRNGPWSKPTIPRCR